MAMKSMITGNANKDRTILNFNPMLSFANETIKVFKRGFMTTESY